jgi:hypothetical protein
VTERACSFRATIGSICPGIDVLDQLAIIGLQSIRRLVRFSLSTRRVVRTALEPPAAENSRPGSRQFIHSEVLMRRPNLSCSVPCLVAFGFLVTPCESSEFVSASIFDTPESLHAWNSASPQTSDEPLGISLAADFARGLVLTGPATGWYTIVFRESGPDLTGFYRLDSGISTRIGPLPYRTPSAWGLELFADRTHLYYLADQNWTSTAVPYRLYRIDFDGTFTEIGVVSNPALSDPDFRGLTRNPQNGQLYTYDVTQDVLVRIDPLTAASAIIGPLGVSAFAAGALAFSRSGDELMMCSGFGSVFRVNPDTGQATNAGTLPYPTASMYARPAPIPGDLDGDGCVDLQDLATLLSDFGCADGCTGDIDDSGGVDLADLTALLSHFGEC